jgi:hypothetical protein
MQPTQGFEFPADKRDAVEALLKPGAQPRLQSVRPERQVKMERVETVPVITPHPTPIAEPEGISIDLPSRFHYYGFKDLYVKPFKAFHLAKLSKGNETGSLQIIAEACSSVLSTSTGETNVAFDLTMADFNYVLYWLRMNSFSKPQIRFSSECQDPAHLADVEAGKKDKESLIIHTTCTESDITINYLDSAPNPQTYSIMFEDQNLVLSPETLGDSIDFLDSPNWQDEEYQYIARIAAVLPKKLVIDNNLVKLRLADRIKIAKELTADQAQLAFEFAELVDAYGVVEIVTTKCIGCGASGQVKIAVDAPSFLSPQF